MVGQRRLFHLAGARHQRHAARQPAGRDSLARRLAELLAALVEGRERQAIISTLRLCLERQLDIAEGGRNLGRILFESADEQPPVGGHAGVQAHAADGAVAVVVKQAPDADAEADEAFFERPGFVIHFQPPQDDAHRQVAGFFFHLSGEQEDVAVAAGGDVLQPPLAHAPILHRVRPIIRPRPDALGLGGPSAAKRFILRTSIRNYAHR